MIYALTVQGKPFSVNHQYIRKKGAAKYILSNEARVYGDSVGWQIKKQWRSRPLDGNLEVSLYYYFDSHCKLDHLNFNKILLDRCNQIVWRDDSQIKISHHYTCYDKKNSRIEMEIKQISPQTTGKYSVVS